MKAALKWIFLGAGVVTFALLVYKFSRPDFKVPTLGEWTDCDKVCAKDNLFAQKRDDGKCVCLPAPEAE